MTKTHSQHGMESLSATDIWTLNYLFFRTDENTEFKYSLNPRDSDVIQNSTILGGLVGTLVKYTHSGRIEPYLAESFHVEPGNKKWVFKLKPGLSCEDGQKIDSHRFVASLTTSLKRYAALGDALDFENLEGWQEFKNNKAPSIHGLMADGVDNIVFNFRKPPSDLLELLRMPYFGFWCEANFNNDNKWKDDHRITSSGAYTLIPSQSKNSVVLRLRNKSGFQVENSPTEIRFSTVAKSDLSKDFHNTIFEFSKKNDFDDLKPGHQKVVGPPTILFSLALSPFHRGPFADKRNRQIFADRVKKVRKEFPSFPSHFFYFNAQSKLPSRDLSKEKFTLVDGQSKITFAVSSKSLSKTDLQNVDALLTAALLNSGLTHEIIMKDAHDDGWIHKVDSNINFDARISMVDIGGYVINAAIKMMFCSSLGINFGDPSGRIAHLVEKQDTSGGPISQSYVEEFNNIVEDDAIVIPLYHYGLEWRLTSDLDPESLPSVATEPIFEKIKRK
ncbi:MAG: ABC transporter substrate-binding protein [Pseudobdellovibrionaceae bacterium]